MEQPLTHTLDRTMLIQAHPDVVFRFFTDPVRWARWWGAGSTIEPHPGGRVLIRYPDGTEVAGQVVEIVSPERLAFTYGFVKGTPIAPGSSLVTIVLEPHRAGTRLRLSHAFTDQTVRDEHVQGWRYQLSLFSNAVADELYGGADRIVDQWFAAWSEADTDARERTIKSIVNEEVQMRDRFSAIDGIGDLLEHLAAVRKFMPGITIARDGDVRHCQGTVLAEWTVKRADGQQVGSGTNVFVLGPDNRLRSITGLWR